MRGKLGLFVSGADRARLAAIIADRNRARKHVWRAEVVLLTADRVGTAEIIRRTGLSKPSVWRWGGRPPRPGVRGKGRGGGRPLRAPAQAGDCPGGRKKTQNPGPGPPPAGPADEAW